MPADYSIAQITDLHLQPDPSQPYRGLDLSARLEAVLDDIARQGKPDLLMMTGDLTHHGNVDTYRWLRNRTADVAHRAVWLPGNHDLLELMEGELLQPVIELDEWQILLLDSTSSPDGQGSGALAPLQLEKLEQQLNANSKPALLVMHHNPLATKSEWQDEIMLANAAVFWSRVQRYPQVQAVLHGHLHQAFDQHRGDIRVLGTPAIAPQFKAQQADFLLEDQPELAGPGWRQLKLGADGCFSTRLFRCPDPSVIAPGQQSFH